MTAREDRAGERIERERAGDRAFLGIDEQGRDLPMDSHAWDDDGFCMVHRRYCSMAASTP